MTSVLRFTARVIRLTLLGVTATLVPVAAADSKHGPDHAAAAFSFALVGDLPYGGADVSAFDHLIAEVNRDGSIRFVMHAGDVKGGSERCDNALLRSRFDQFQQFAEAFILTPGDNDWTDCHRVSNGSYHPLERLAFLRSLYYPDPDMSTGQRPIRVTPQSAFPAFAPYVENVLFTLHRVVFTTIHVVGSNNDLAPWTGFDPSDSPSTPRADRIAEFNERLGAALAWLDETFRHATEIDAAGVFLLIQANPLFELPASDPQRSGFNAFLDRLKPRVASFPRPVVLAHGDFHEFLIDKPFNRAPHSPRLPYFTRIQTFGNPSVHWIKVTVDPKSSSVFTFEEKIVPQNVD